MHSRSAPAAAVSSIALLRSLHTCRTALLHWYRLPHRRFARASRRLCSSEVWISKGHAEIREAVSLLLPADHAVSIVLQNEHHEIKAKPHRRFHLLGIHHKAAIATHGKHPPTRIEYRDRDPYAAPVVRFKIRSTPSFSKAATSRSLHAPASPSSSWI
jgi:hypothetical protein